MRSAAYIHTPDSSCCHSLNQRVPKFQNHVHPPYPFLHFLLIHAEEEGKVGYLFGFLLVQDPPFNSHLPHHAECNRPWSLGLHKPDSLKG